MGPQCTIIRPHVRDQQLSPDTPDVGPVFPSARRALADHAKKAGELEKWKYDGVRHTFATHHVAGFRDPGRTSLILGHKGSLTMLRDHYMGLETKAQGEAYFGI